MPKDNRKLTNQEDDANLQEILNDDSPIPEDVDPADHTGDPTPPADDDDDVVVPGDDADDDDDTTPPADPKDDIDYKDKFRASSREATTLHFKNKKITDTVEQASQLPEPTVDELKAFAKTQGAEYDDLDEFSQNILKKTYINEKRFEMIHSVTTENKALDVWADKVDEFTNSPSTLSKYPSIGEYDVDFKKYCMKEGRRGMDLEDLVGSFLFSIQSDDPQPKPQQPKKKSKLLSGGGGGDSIPKPKQLTAEEARIIRAKDPRRYKNLVKEGKIGLDILDRE